MTSKNKHYCSVPQCNNFRSTNRTLHTFPKDKSLKENWKIKLRIGKPISKWMMVCSEHFLPTDFYPANEYTKKVFLKKGAVPSQKIPRRQFDTIQTASTSARASRDINRRTSKTCSLPLLSEDSLNRESEESISEIHLDAENAIEMQVESPRKFTEVGIQVNTILDLEPKRDFANYLLESSYKLSVFCGINVQVFNAIEKASVNTLRAFKSMNNSNLRTKICVALTKLKLDLSYRAIGVVFEISSTTAQNYFIDMIQILYFTLRNQIYLPSREENLANLPKCFDKYRNVRIVIDATEVFIQKSQCLQCRIRTYSHYKKGHTAKYLICICLAGLISYVSSAYGGRASDKAIFNSENIMAKLDDFHGAIMVDKGVLIEQECLDHGIQLIRPPFLRKKPQFSKEEALQTVSIARARVHVERSIQRIKIFKIFANRLEWSLVPYLDEMMVVVCALVNLTRPILSDNKF